MRQKFALIFALALFAIPFLSHGQTYGGDVLTNTCTADTVEGGEVCTKAHNGNTADGWLSTNTAFPHWISFDLGVGVTALPAKVRIAPYADVLGAMFKNFTVQGSNDDSNYFTIYSGLASNTTTSGVFQDFEFTATTTAYRYFKFNFADSFNATNQTYEMEIQAMDCTDCGGGGGPDYGGSSFSFGSSTLNTPAEIFNSLGIDIIYAIVFIVIVGVLIFALR